MGMYLCNTIRLCEPGVHVWGWWVMMHNLGASGYGTLAALPDANGDENDCNTHQNADAVSDGDVHPDRHQVIWDCVVLTPQNEPMT